MDKKYIVSKISENATDLESDSYYNNNWSDSSDSFDIEYSNLKPSDQQNNYIGNYKGLPKWL